MAIDLASSSSPFEFQNMLPLDVLAAVATEKLRDEIHSPGTQKVKASCFVKRNIKKASTSILTFQEIKCMPVKFLVEKFSEMTSDEYTKKYSYKCMLLPHKCSTTFKSYGNEKKACDEMKSHLRLHIQQLTADYESNKEISELLFSPKSPNSSSKHPEKLPKKILKQQTPLNGTIPRVNPSKISKKPKSTAFSVKPAKKKFIENKYIPELSNDSQEESNSDYVADYPLIERMIADDFFRSEEKCFLNKRIKKEKSKVFDSENETNHYGSYSQHLKIAFFTDVELREDNSESLSDSDEISFSSDSNSSQEDNSKSSQYSDASFDKSIIFLQDHNYACYENTKNDKLSSTEVRGTPRRYKDPFLYNTPELPPYVIKTPPYPHLHVPLLPEVAEIIEIKMQDPSDMHSHCIDYLYDNNTPKSDNEESLTDDYTDEYDNEDKYPDDFFYKMNSSSGSVLECIENKKHSNSCLPKNEIDVNENNENLENVLKDEKELALKFIAKLHTKGKKKVSDSLVCQICPDKSFTAQATLIHHYRSHAGIKPYICKLCSSKFTRQHSLNYHMLIHNNLSRFACDYCGRTFRHPSHYKEHLRRHTGETPYHCTECSLQFKTRNTFKRHLKTRHGKLLTPSGVEDLNAE